MPAPIQSLPPASKRRKIEQKFSALSTSIQQLEINLIAALNDNASLNPLADLLHLTLASKTPQDTSKAIYALYRLFVLIIARDRLGFAHDDAAKVVKAWLWDRLNTFVDYLGGLLKDEEKSLRVSNVLLPPKCYQQFPLQTSALEILFSLQKHLSTSYSKSSPSQPQFHTSHFRKIISFLLLCPKPTCPQQKNASANTTTIDPDVLHHFHETWFSVHDDVRWFFLRDAA